MKRITVMALAGWAGIVWLAYSLASARIGLCYFHDTACIIRTTATRDNVLIWGAAVALLGLIVAAALEWRASSAPAQSATREARRLVR